VIVDPLAGITYQDGLTDYTDGHPSKYSYVEASTLIKTNTLCS